MPFEDLCKWQAYFERRPFGWRDDYRFYTVLSAFSKNLKPGEIFPSLKEVLKSKSTNANLMNLENSSLFSKLQGAVGGVNIFDESEN